MQGDPYGRMIKLMIKHGSANNPPGIELGTVSSIKPLIIQVGDLQIDKDNILIADYLLNDYTRKCELNGDVKVEIPVLDGTTAGANVGDNGSHSHSFEIPKQDITIGEENINITDITFVDSLEAGDLLAIMPTMDMQTYIVLARVVSIDG